MIHRANIHTSYYALTAIIVTGFLLRIIWIQNTPPGLNSDELLKAYDGASLFHTGMDHHGAAFPIFFEQSGEYSPPLYIYFSGIFSALFGINPFSVRIPSIILGTLSILFTFCLMKQISTSFTALKTAALTAAALAAISPWNIFYSRLGWEAILQVPLQLLAFWLFLRWHQTKKLSSILLSSIAFALCFYAYPTERLFIPLMLILLTLVSYKQIIQLWKQSMICFMVFLILMMPTLHFYLYHHRQMQARWDFLSVLNQPGGVLLFFQQWLEHLSPSFLFISGSSFGMMGGMALLVLLPFFYGGLWICIRRHNTADMLLIAWFLFYSVPASMTFDRYDPNSMPNSLRTTCGMPILEIISTIGLYSCLEWITTPRFKTIFIYTFLSAVTINSCIVLFDYYFIYSQRTIQSSQYGFKELIEYTEEQKEQYDKIIISHKIGLHPISIAAFSMQSPAPFSYMDYPKYVLPFYHYAPTYHDWGTEEYDRFGLINRWYYQGNGKLLIAAKANEIQEETPIHIITYPNGIAAIEFYAIDR